MSTQPRLPYVVDVDGCTHYANAPTISAARELAQWCHDRAYCYHRQPPEPGDVVTVSWWTGNQPPRRHQETVTVLESGDRHTRVRGETGRERLVDTRWLTRTARRPLDNTPPGPLTTGYQPTLFDSLESP